MTDKLPDDQNGRSIYFRTIRIKDGDRVNNIITNSLEKYSLKNSKLSGWKLCQKNENGNELIFTENSSVYHAVCGYKGEFAQAVWNFIQSDFS